MLHAPLLRPLRKRPSNALGHLRRRRVVGASLAALAARRAAAEAPWPEKPVRLLVGMPPGQVGDLLARGLAPHLAAAFGQPFIVENRPGAGGTIAAGAVAQARDLHSLGIVVGGPTTTARTLNPALGYDPARDFTSVSLLVRASFVLVLHPAVPARSWAEFVALARARPEAVSYASIGAGTVTHLAMEELKARLGFEITHVPYRGFPPATLDLLAGRVQAMFNVMTVAEEHIRAGTLVPVVQSGEARLPSLPAVPTFAEAGLDDTSFFGWTGLVAPAGFPRGTAERVARAVREALDADPALRAPFEAAGTEVLGTSPAALDALQRREAARWNAVITRLGLRVTD